MLSEEEDDRSHPRDAVARPGSRRSRPRPAQLVRRDIPANVSSRTELRSMSGRMHTLGYVRQSRESQAGASTEAQRRAIERYAESQGWRLIETFSDIGRSGFDPKAQRPGLEELLRTAERGGVDRVVVWKLDRLTRRGISEALAIVERIEAAGAALV